MICYSPHILTKNKFRNFKNFYSYGNTRNTLFESENGSIFAFHFRFRTGWKDLEYRFHHCLSKFVRSVLVNIKTISYFFEFTWFGFWSKNYWKLVIDHDLMANLRKKIHWNLNSGRSNLITPVQDHKYFWFVYDWGSLVKIIW